MLILFPAVCEFVYRQYSNALCTWQVLFINTHCHDAVLTLFVCVRVNWCTLSLYIHIAVIIIHNISHISS